MISDLLVEVDRLFDDLGIAHAFGGAMALNYYAEPRATTDVDVNVATDVAGAPGLVGELAAAGFVLDRPLDELVPISGARLRRGVDVLDLFLSFDAFHHRLLGRARRVPIRATTGTAEIPILSADDLVVVKLSCNRGKDWVDVEAMVAAGVTIDVPLVEAELIGLRGPTMDPRVARLREVIASIW